MHEGVLFVPTYYDKHESFSLFEKTDRPIYVEFCSGNGDWVVSKAKEFPQFYWVAVEKRFDRVRKIWSKMKNSSVSNLLIVCGDALTFCRFYVPKAAFDEIFINFPDPWPKRGHAKHRLIQKPFVEESARVVKEGGNAMFVTDDEQYSSQMIEEMHGLCAWRSRLPSPYYLTKWPGYGDSFFETLWRAKGCQIRYHQFERKADG